MSIEPSTRNANRITSAGIHNAGWRRNAESENVDASSGAPRARATAAYRYLPASVAYLPPTGELLSLISAAGFTSVERRTLSGGIAQLLAGTRS